MPEEASTLVVTPRLHVPLAEFEWSFARSSGPGGQNVNKVNSKAQLRWKVAENTSLPEGVRERFKSQFGNRISQEGDLVLVSQRYRDQPKNIEDCLAKLREMLLQVAAAPKRRRPTKPSRAAKQRRLNEKKAKSERKATRRERFD